MDLIRNDVPTQHIVLNTFQFGINQEDYLNGLHCTKHLVTVISGHISTAYIYGVIIGSSQRLTAYLL